MICKWQELLRILPQTIRAQVDRLGRDSMKELRLRLGAAAELVCSDGSHWLTGKVSMMELEHCVQAASSYSPWAAQSVAKGYLTIPGGHRMGICGQAVLREGAVTGIRNVRSICIRVARDYPGISEQIGNVTGSALIIGAPGWGKTTLLRDLARRIGQESQIAVVDEREELYPLDFPLGKRMDVLSGVPKPQGIDMVLRSMGPEWIAMDEITAQGDCMVLLQAYGCGVKLLATAHAGSRRDLYSRPLYKPLLDMGVFETLVVLHPDQSYGIERMLP